MLITEKNQGLTVITDETKFINGLFDALKNNHQIAVLGDTDCYYNLNTKNKRDWSKLTDGDHLPFSVLDDMRKLVGDNFYHVPMNNYGGQEIKQIAYYFCKTNIDFLKLEIKNLMLMFNIFDEKSAVDFIDRTTQSAWDSFFPEFITLESRNSPGNTIHNERLYNQDVDNALKLKIAFNSSKKQLIGIFELKSTGDCWDHLDKIETEIKIEFPLIDLFKVCL